MTATVYLADDHPSFRDGLARAIDDHPDLELAGAAADGATALDDLRRLEPDVAVLDFNMPGRDGLEVTRALAEGPTAVVMVTASVSAYLVCEVIEAGAVTVLGKEARRTEVCDAIVAAAHGERRMPTAIEDLLAEEQRFRERQRSARARFAD